ncbi:hypothetical protein ACVWYQ_003260 [Bradyrhizobium sp. USDA 3397]
MSHIGSQVVGEARSVKMSLPLDRMESLGVKAVQIINEPLIGYPDDGSASRLLGVELVRGATQMTYCHCFRLGGQRRHTNA